MVSYIHIFHGARILALASHLEMLAFLIFVTIFLQMEFLFPCNIFGSSFSTSLQECEYRESQIGSFIFASIALWTSLTRCVDLPSSQ